MNVTPETRSVTPRRAHRWPVVHTIGRSVLAAVFLVAGLSKLRNPYAFLISVYQFELFSAEQARWIASTLPFLELALGVCLLLGVLRRSVSILMVLLLTTFVGVLTSVVVRGIKTSCGCFGEVEAADIGWPTVVRSVALLAVGLLTVYSGTEAKHQPDTETGRAEMGPETSNTQYAG